MRAPPWITVIPHQLLTEIPSCEAGYMAAPERFADSQIPLAPRARFIAPFRTLALNGRFRGEADVDRSSPLANRDANDRNRAPMCFHTAKTLKGHGCGTIALMQYSVTLVTVLSSTEDEADEATGTPHSTRRCSHLVAYRARTATRNADRRLHERPVTRRFGPRCLCVPTRLDRAVCRRKEKP